MNQPSRDDEARRPDLAAEARSRPPSSVDAGDLEEGGEMTIGAKAVVPALAGTLALSGCAAPPDERRGAAERARAQVREVSNGVLSTLSGIGAPHGPSTGAWEGCADLGGRVEFHVTGRLDPTGGSDGPLDASGHATAVREEPPRFVDRVVDALAVTGWRLEPVRPGDDPVTLEAVRGDVNVQVSGYTAGAFVLFDISGPCVEVGDLGRELLAEPPETVPASAAGGGARL